MNTHIDYVSIFKPHGISNVISTRVPLENTSFINRLVVYYAREYGAFETGSKEAQQEVKSLVQCILQNGDEKFKKCEIVSCGGFFENQNHPNTKDCDFNVIPDIPDNYVNFTHKCNPETHATSRAKRHRYFTGSVTEKGKSDPIFVDRWKCQDPHCYHTEPTVECIKAFDARVIQDQFCNSIIDGVNEVLEQNGRNMAPYCCKKGPAVTINLEVIDHARLRLNRYITIDLALAISLDKDWKNCDSLKDIGVTNGNVVPSGDFWRLSFSDIETRLIVKQSKEVKAVYIAAKAIRDSIIPDFPTYPIKQAFLHELRNIRTKMDDASSSDRKFWCLAECVCLIFDHMTDATEKDEFTNYHQNNDPVMEKSDAEFIQSKAFKEYVIEQNASFLRRGRYLIGFAIMILMYNLYAVYVGLGGLRVTLLPSWLNIYFIHFMDQNISITATVCVIMLIVMYRNRTSEGPLRTFYSYGVVVNFVLPTICTLGSTILETVCEIYIKHDKKSLFSDSTRKILHLIRISFASTAVGLFLVNVLVFISANCVCKHKWSRGYAYECVLSQQFWLRMFSPKREYILHPIRDSDTESINSSTGTGVRDSDTECINSSTGTGGRNSDTERLIPST